MMVEIPNIADMIVKQYGFDIAWSSPAIYSDFEDDNIVADIDTSTITIRDDMPYIRCRYVLAHCLAYIRLKYVRPHRVLSADLKVNNMDFVNDLALKILIPLEMIEYLTLHTKLDLVEQANLLKVSQLALYYRLKQTGWV